MKKRRTMWRLWVKTIGEKASKDDAELRSKYLKRRKK